MANPNIDTLNKLAQARLDEARLLLANGYFSGAAYLSGYAIELKLKSKICERLDWTEYPPSSGKDTPQSGDCLKSHKLAWLATLAGVLRNIPLRDEDEHGLSILSISNELIPYWKTLSDTKNWSEQKRYEEISPENSKKLLAAVEAVFKYLNEGITRE